MHVRVRSPLAIADEVFAALVCPPAPLALDAAELGLGAAGVRIVLGELRDLLRAPDTPNEVKNRCWRGLVGRAQRHGGAWTIAAVGVALGPLVGVATELANDGKLARPDLDAEVLAGFLSALARANPQADGLFPALIRAAREAGLTWVRHLRAADTPLCDLDDYTSAPPPPLSGHPDLVLADAVAAGVITTAEAELIGETRLGGVTLRQIAAREGLTHRAIRTRRARAEKRLVTALLAARAADRDDDPTHIQALHAAGLARRVRITRPLRAPRPRHTPTPANAGDPPGGDHRDPRGELCGTSAGPTPSSRQEGPRPPAHPTARDERRSQPKAA
jgi:hypothetical protein